MKKLALLSLAIATSLLVVGQNDTPQTPAPAPASAPAAQNSQSTQKVRLGLAFSPVASWYAASGDAGTIEPDGARFNVSFGLNIDFKIAQNNNYFFSTGLFLLNTGGTLKHDFFNEVDGELF